MSLLSPQESSIAIATTDPTEQLAKKIAVFTGGLLILSGLAACYVAAEIILPICVAFMLNLVFRPAIRFMHRLRIPSSLAAMVIVLGLIGSFLALGTALSGPAADWGEKLPTALPKLHERLEFLIRPATTIQQTVSQAENVTLGKDTKALNVIIRGNGLTDKLFSSTRVLVGGVFEMLLVLFFLLIAGDTFQQKFIEILPKFQDKKKALQISRQIETDIAAYLRTITLMNLLVGIAAGLIMYCYGVGDAVLWGTAAFLLNYVPILGPLTATGLFIIAGMLANDNLVAALIPAALYFAVHLAEGQVITPLLVSRRFTLNPALVILMLIFWYWMWGVAGAILATPMLAIFKTICDRTNGLQPIGHLIEG